MADTTSLMFKVLSVLFTGSVLMIKEIFLNSLILIWIQLIFMQFNNVDS